MQGGRNLPVLCAFLLLPGFESCVEISEVALGTSFFYVSGELLQDVLVNKAFIRGISTTSITGTLKL